MVRPKCKKLDVLLSPGRINLDNGSNCSSNLSIICSRLTTCSSVIVASWPKLEISAIIIHNSFSSCNKVSCTTALSEYARATPKNACASSIVPYVHTRCDAFPTRSPVYKPVEPVSPVFVYTFAIVYLLRM